MSKTCYHCGTPCDPSLPIVVDGKDFCCSGCKTVYEILTESRLTSYYEMEKNPGAPAEENEHKYAFLDNERIVERLLDFNEESVQIVSLYIPHIHCSSCIWVLENLKKLDPAISSSQVDFPKKRVRIVYHSQQTSLKAVVNLLSRIGYAPYISLEDYNKREDHQARTIYYKLGVAGFAFGNVMLLSFPEYFETDEFWLNQYKVFFRWLMFALSLPVVSYAASDYFISAYKGLKTRVLNIDVPLALGIAVLFFRSTYDIVTDSGSGFFDSLTGLLFFLLLGRFFQQKTYNFLSFERDYKSYFPIGVTKILPDGSEESVEVYNIAPGDRLLIRAEEIIPVDAILIKGEGMIDYSFVTGESVPVHRISGDKLFAGGKQTRGAIEVEVLKEVSQSYLTQLWSNAVFDKSYEDKFKTLTDRISRYFTIVILIIAVLALAYWYVFYPRKAFEVFTAVLIIACPCALAMSAPFTLGNILRIFGYLKLYLKNAKVVEKMAKVDTIIFDKTGTITTSHQNQVSFRGVSWTPWQKRVVKSVLRSSNHPLSRAIYDSISIGDEALFPMESFEEVAGKGLMACVEGKSIRIGSSQWVCGKTSSDGSKTEVFVSIEGELSGKFVFENVYRQGVSSLFERLSKKYRLAVLSGDNQSEYETLKEMLPSQTWLVFNQKPSDKLAYIADLQKKGHAVMMIGDGLNDAGALKQSDVGIALAENVNVFSPACDGIIDADKLTYLDYFMSLSQKSINVIKISFVLSFLYNIVGLSFAVAGKLSPVVAAILMPLSSISVVIFTTMVTNIIARRRKE